MNPNGPERRDTSPKGEAIRHVINVELAYGLRVENVESGGETIRHLPTMTIGRLSGILGRMWVIAYARGRHDAVSDLSESLIKRIDEVLGEMR